MKTAYTAAAMLLLAASPAMALEVRESARLPAPIDHVWPLVGPFCGIGDWHPAAERCELRQDGKTQVRVIHLKGGGAIEEKLLSASDSRHRVTYAILSGPLPVKDYVATMTVTPKGKGTEVVWKANFKANGVSDAEARKAISGVFTSGLDGLKQKAGTP